MAKREGDAAGKRETSKSQGKELTKECSNSNNQYQSETFQPHTTPRPPNNIDRYRYQNERKCQKKKGTLFETPSRVILASGSVVTNQNNCAHPDLTADS